jgi:hypothetical protein
MKHMIAPLYLVILTAALTPTSVQAAPNCPYWSCEERLNPFIQQTEHRFVSSELQGDIHCNGNPPGHGTCHTGYMFDTCYSHGVCHPPLAISDVEELVLNGRHDRLGALLSTRDSGVEFIAGGIALVSTCSDAIIAAYPIPEAERQLVRSRARVTKGRSA